MKFPPSLITLFMFLICFPIGSRAAQSTPQSTPQSKDAYPLKDLSPLVKPSYYTQRILKFLDRWPPPTLSLKDERPIFIRAIKTPKHDDAIGTVKHFTVDAPLERVVETCERFEDYPKIWENVLSVKVLSRDKNRTVTEWVRKAPAFFLSKGEYKALYITDKSNPDRVIFRQQLIEGNSLNASDLIAVFERASATTTRVSVVSFYEANFGPFRGVAEGKIWRKTMEGSFKDDIAFRARIEHPDWNVDQITEASEKALDKTPIDEVQYTDLLKLDE